MCASINGIQLKGRKTYKDENGERLTRATIYVDGNRIGGWELRDAFTKDIALTILPNYSKEKIDNRLKDFYEDDDFITDMKWRDIGGLIYYKLLTLMDDERCFEKLVKQCSDDYPDDMQMVVFRNIKNSGRCTHYFYMKQDEIDAFQSYQDIYQDYKEKCSYFKKKSLIKKNQCKDTFDRYREVEGFYFIKPDNDSDKFDICSADDIFKVHKRYRLPEYEVNEEYEKEYLHFKDKLKRDERSYEKYLSEYYHYKDNLENLKSECKSNGFYIYKDMVLPSPMFYMNRCLFKNASDYGTYSKEIRFYKDVSDFQIGKGKYEIKLLDILGDDIDDKQQEIFSLFKKRKNYQFSIDDYTKKGIGITDFDYQKRTISPDRLDAAMIMLERDKMSFRNVAKETGISVSTLQREKKKRMDMPYENLHILTKKLHYNEDVISTALKLLETMSYDKVSSLTGISKSTLYRKKKAIKDRNKTEYKDE